MAPKRLAVLGMLIAASLLAACAGQPAPLKPTAAPRIEGIVSLHARKVETANASPAVEELNADVQRWIEAVGQGRGSPPEVTGDKRAVVASKMRESGEYEVTVWRTARGDQLSGALAGRPFARQSSENFLRYEKADSSEHIVRLDTWQSIPIPSEIRWVEVSRDGKWLGISGDHIVAGRIGEDRLLEDLRIRMPDGAPSLREHSFSYGYKVYWLPQQNAALLSTGVLVDFDPAAARLLEVGTIVGVVEKDEIIVHKDESGRRLFATRIRDDGSLDTEPLDHDPIRHNWRVRLLSPSGHYAVAGSGTKWPSERLIRIRQFPAWGSEFPRRRQSLVADWLVIRNHSPPAPLEEGSR